MPDQNHALLDKLLQSKKYRDICPDTVRRVWAECEKKYKKPKDVDKAAREALHGITGAFMTPEESSQLGYDMQQWWCSKTDFSLERMLQRHASTRERLPLASMDALYDRIFGITGIPRSVLDLACGINPLYLGARGIETLGVDISGQSVAAVNRFGEVYGMPVSAACADLLCPGAVPSRRFDMALLFKLLPLLERQRPGAAPEVLQAVNAEWLVVSFPTRTLGGRNVGMAAHYADWMADHLPGGRAVADRFETENELYFILK
ncbi:MAG: Rmt family 16S rRNA (guanine(1405)-N(7))-methyltransferase [Clostridia bacterium]|nr:Rmt family 16S rRNA (guanine(1405)-N(7))-methyltransferase [Clostridia bacterium]